MSRLAFLAAVVAGPLLLGACAASPPGGPDVWALPGEGKDLAHFQQDEANCRSHALGQTGFDPSRQGARGGGSGELQRRYDLAYLQCMAERGNKVPATAMDEPHVITPYSRGYPDWYGTPYYGYFHGYPGPYYGAGISPGDFHR